MPSMSFILFCFCTGLTFSLSWTAYGTQFMFRGHIAASQKIIEVYPEGVICISALRIGRLNFYKQEGLFREDLSRSVSNLVLNFSNPVWNKLIRSQLEIEKEVFWKLEVKTQPVSAPGFSCYDHTERSDLAWPIRNKLWILEIRFLNLHQYKYICLFISPAPPWHQSLQMCTLLQYL